MSSVTDRLFATDEDPDLIVARSKERRDQSNAQAIERWRAWLAQHHEATLALSLDELERRHDFIQWWFPIGAKSPINPDAPVIGRHAMRDAVQADPELAAAMRRSFHRFLQVLGLALEGGQVREVNAPVVRWIDRATHTDRRLSRALRSMHNAGLHDETRALMAFLELEMKDRPARWDALRWWRHQLVDA
ncbi:opioid growth factor receptor-related protein [Piscinibacterium candidicorallinum]|uniref:Opioid growth factor receptor-related protein n=1 Tax=Piscinibacterium candidicorallinum TaxID=1793872 RepID=A0ABV7H6Q8_9BURK